MMGEWCIPRRVLFRANYQEKRKCVLWTFMFAHSVHSVTEFCYIAHRFAIYTLRNRIEQKIMNGK